MRHKSFTAEIKSAAAGEIEAVFATMNTVDLDGDWTQPGAFGTQDVQISAYNHGSWSGSLPVGRGRVSERGNDAVLTGQFLMNVPAARDTFETVNALGSLMEWSYGFDVLDAEPGERDGRPVQVLKRLKVHEVSPVIRGAGVDTRTLSAKRAASANTITSEEARIAEWKCIRADPELQRAARARVQVRLMQEEQLAAERIGHAMILLRRYGR
jgi:phage head maturation protease